MSVSNDKLAASVLNASQTATPVTLAWDLLSVFATMMVTKFTLGPDVTADIKRIPDNVRSLAELYAWMSQLADDIARDKKSQETKGLVRTFKNIVVSCHILAAYLKDPKSRLPETYFAHATAALGFSNQARPTGLSTNGNKVWEGAIKDASSRLIMILIFIFRIASKDSTMSDTVKSYSLTQLRKYEAGELGFDEVYTEEPEIAGTNPTVSSQRKTPVAKNPLSTKVTRAFMTMGGKAKKNAPVTGAELNALCSPEDNSDVMLTKLLCQDTNYRFTLLATDRMIFSDPDDYEGYIVDPRLLMSENPPEFTIEFYALRAAMKNLTEAPEDVLPQAVTDLEELLTYFRMQYLDGQMLDEEIEAGNVVLAQQLSNAEKINNAKALLTSDDETSTTNTGNVADNNKKAANQDA